MGPRAPTPTLVRLTKNDASPPLGLSGTHASAHTPSMTPPRAAGHASDGDGTCQVPTGAAPRSAEYITSFLQHIRHGAASKAAAPAGVSQLPPPASSVAEIASVDRPADDGQAATARDARAAAPPSPRKRRRSCGPAHEARRKAFYDSTEPRTTGVPSTQVGADTKGVDGRGV